MRSDFDAIPDADERRAGGGTALSRIYHDIGLAAVAEALDLLTADFDPDLNSSLERGEFYLLPSAGSLARSLAVA
jgi:hypothetical protein